MPLQDLPGKVAHQIYNISKYEQSIRVVGSEGQETIWHRIRVELDMPTRRGEDRLYILTNLPPELNAGTMARLYRDRWRIETAFYHLAPDLNTEIQTLYQSP